MTRASRLVGAAIALLAGLGVEPAARSGIDEAWLRRAGLPEDVRPLLAVILDRSASTARTLTVDEDYDALRDYGTALTGTAACDPAKLYFRRGPGPAPDCAYQAGVDRSPTSMESGLHCESARAALAVSGFYVASRAAQWRPAGDGGHWDAPDGDSAGAIECRADRGRHGSAPGTWFASAGTGSPWAGTALNEIDWDRPPFADAFIFYSGNFLNYLRSARTQVDRSIADVAASRLASALASTGELEVALVRVDDDGPDGGYVASAPVASADAAALLQSLSASTPAGSAPLAETLTEAALWLAGGVRRFGGDGRADPAAFGPAASATYRSPYDHACRPISVAYVTAYEASDDDLAASAAAALPGFSEEAGGCGADCLGTLAGWLGRSDLRRDLPGLQSAPLAFIATPEAAPALAGASLADPLAYANLVASAFQRDALVVAGPQLSAAGLVLPAPGAGEPGVVYGLVAPRFRERWPGNLLRYGLRAPSGPLAPPLVVDREGNPAIDDATGVPRPGTWSLWSDAPDADLLAGGAAGRLPPADARNIYTDLASGRLRDPDNRLVPGNPRIDRVLLALGATDPEPLDDALAWAAEQATPGDPGLHAPAIVDYPAAGIRVAYAATQDGLLHAFDADSGVELWAWMPRDLLSRVPLLMRDAQTTARSHGIDGPLVLHRHDPDRDGRIARDDGEHLWLLFGLGRGGGRYYALDVADHAAPQLLWTFELPDAGVESLAEPVVTRLAIEGSGQGADEWVVLLSGGYDRRFDTRGAAGAGAGGALYLVDAATGRLLWSAGGADGDLALPGMASLPSAARALDRDGDGQLDRAWLVDVTGDVWRLDFRTGTAAGELASARRIARLGGGGRRFLATPDVSIARIGGVSRIAIAVGSGWGRSPQDATVEDRLYVVFDDAAGGGAVELTEADLFDATDAESEYPPDAPGWFLRLTAHGAGEKVIGPVVTFDHVLRFQTYQPLPLDPEEPCGPPRSVSRRHELDIRTARPPMYIAESEEEEDEIAATGLPPGLRFGFPGRWDEPCEGCRPRPFGILGGETFDPGYAGDPVRTSWRKLAPPPASP